MSNEVKGMKHTLPKPRANIGRSMQDVSQEVIRRAAEGDTEAFEEILTCYGDLVFNVSLRVLRSREDAQEATQDVFLTLHRKLRDFEGRSSLKTWIYRIAMNTAINYSRKVIPVRDRTVEYDETAGDGYAGQVSDRTEQEYAEHVVDQLLGLLSSEQRSCVVLRNIEGMSYEQIAQTLGIDINSVRSRLKRARDKMMARKEEVMRDGL